jgi:hypothetical protein
MNSKECKIRYEMTFGMLDMGRMKTKRANDAEKWLNGILVAIKTDQNRSSNSLTALEIQLAYNTQ